MRKFCLLMSIVLAVVLLSACTPIQKNGLENFEKYDCTFELTANLFPSDDFIQKYDYVQGDYQYFDNCDLWWGYSKAFARLTYTPEVYEVAKQHCLDSFVLSEKHTYRNSQYVFTEHLCYKSKNEAGERVLESDFPRHFNMFGYDDETCTLFFIGYYNGDPNSAERKLAQTDFYSFLSKVYGEYYSFVG